VESPASVLALCHCLPSRQEIKCHSDAVGSNSDWGWPFVPGRVGYAGASFVVCAVGGRSSHPPAVTGRAGRREGQRTRHRLSRAFVVDKVDKVIINTPEMAWSVPCSYRLDGCRDGLRGGHL